MTNLGTITPYLFGDHLLISLSKEWLDKFAELPKFIAKIDEKGRLCLVSTCEVKACD